MSRVENPQMAAAIEAIAVGHAALLETGVAPANERDAIVCIKELEALRRAADAACVDLMASIEREHLHRSDGHATAKAMVRHHARLSGGEAAARQRSVRVSASCPEIAEAYRAGQLGTDQIRQLGRIHANPRTRSRMVERQGWFLDKARLDYDDFAERTNQWMRLTDEDGPTPPNERAHEDRNVRFTQEFDTTWNMIGQFASGQGFQIHEVFEHYVRAETLADWEKARAEHGDAATADHLPRTIQQRRADAFAQIFIDAAANPNSAVPADFVHHIFWDADTFEEIANRFLHDALDEDTEGEDTEGDEPFEPTPLDPDTTVCRSLDGVRLDPTEAFSTTLVAKIRRVLIDARSTVVDLGVARFFTGNARHAVKIASTTCVWPGCHTPSSACEADHLDEHGQGGRTNPGNGAPLCGKHNRWKQKGFTVWRDPAGPRCSTQSNSRNSKSSPWPHHPPRRNRNPGLTSPKISSAPAQGRNVHQRDPAPQIVMRVRSSPMMISPS